MATKFEPARIRVKVPARKWKSKAEVEAWARGQLAGGPPRLTATIPESHPDAGRRATWKDIQSGVLENNFVVLESEPPGLIMRDGKTGERKFVPSASRSGLVLGKTQAAEFIGSIELEGQLRAFVTEENRVFNKLRQEEGERTSQSWTLEWYRHGRRVRQFAGEHPEVSMERIWQELVNWGRGQHGYSRQTHQDATYFSDWLATVSENHSVFQLSTTRIQHILWADRGTEGRARLLDAAVSGPLATLTDDEFAWAVGKRKKNWPLEERTREELAELGNRIKGGHALSEAEAIKLAGILARVREFPKRRRDPRSEGSGLKQTG